MEAVIEFDDAATAAMNEIRSQTQLDDSAVLSRALGLMRWAVRQRNENRIVAALDESQHTYRELDLDAALPQPQSAAASAVASEKVGREKKGSKVDHTPKGRNSVTPCLAIRGAAKAIEYYKNVFGATVVARMNRPDGLVGYAELQIGDSRIVLAEENPNMGNRAGEGGGGSSVSLYVYLRDCDAVVAKAMAEGAKLLMPVQDHFYGDRSGFLQDPFGYRWGIATHIEDVSAEEIERRAKEAMQAQRVA